MKNALVIPVRIDSSRLSRKALLEIEGKTLIQRVVDQCKKTNLPTYVVTDSEEIEQSLDPTNIKIILQKKSAESGTERISNAIQNIEGDYIINVQGDQPFIEPESIIEMNDFIIKNSHHMVVTPIKLFSEKYEDPSKCKVITDLFGRAIYFSRSPIPYNAKESYGHLGVYGYQRKVLENYKKLKTSPLEKVEKLEQLRFIDNGIPIQTYKTNYSIFSIDTQVDLIDAIEYARKLI